MSQVKAGKIVVNVEYLSDEEKQNLQDSIQAVLNDAVLSWLPGRKIIAELEEVPRVVINMHRGLLENVRSSTDWLDVLVLDDDLDGVDQERIVKVEGRDTTAEFYCFEIADYLGQLFGTVEGLIPADE